MVVIADRRIERIIDGDCSDWSGAAGCGVVDKTSRIQVAGAGGVGRRREKSLGGIEGISRSKIDAGFFRDCGNWWRAGNWGRKGLCGLRRTRPVPTEIDTASGAKGQGREEAAMLEGFGPQMRNLR